MGHGYDRLVSHAICLANIAQSQEVMPAEAHVKPDRYVFCCYGRIKRLF